MEDTKNFYGKMALFLGSYLVILLSALSISLVPIYNNNANIIVEVAPSDVIKVGDNLQLKVFDKYENAEMKSVSGNAVETNKNGIRNFKWTSIDVSLTPFSVKNSKCFNIFANVTDAEKSPGVCVDLAKLGYIYGGAEVYYQYWPMNKQTLTLQPYVTKDMLNQNKTIRATEGLWGSVEERYWLSSSGVGIHVTEESPLWASQSNNKKQLCFMGQFKDSVYQSSLFYLHTSKIPYLNMTVCLAKDINTVHRDMFPLFYNHPKGGPDERMFKSPIWSTWARYKVNITQDKVLKYANEIIENKFPNSQIEIDDKFSSAYGDFDFVKSKFPDPVQMIKQLHELNFRVTCWVMPFANNDSNAYLTGSKKGVFIKEMSTNETAFVTWWQGKGVTLDVSNPDATKWYTERLVEFKNNNKLDSFKFDAGEVMYLPKRYAAYRQPHTPLEYTRDYVKMVKSFGSMIETRVGHNTQEIPIFVRMFDKDSTWDYDNGLKTMIPNALLNGILGYPFILPDMVGGNAYGNTSLYDGHFPEKELYIRWMQVSAFLPSIQFSITPWDYDAETIAIGHESIRLHQEIFYREMKHYLGEVYVDGTPIIRPLWMNADLSKENLTEVFGRDDEFMVGGRLLVAPVLNKGQVTRDIYLPTGKWSNPEDKKVYSGPQLLKNYPAPLAKIPYFINSEIQISSTADIMLPSNVPFYLLLLTTLFNLLD